MDDNVIDLETAKPEPVSNGAEVSPIVDNITEVAPNGHIKRNSMGLEIANGRGKVGESERDSERGSAPNGHAEPATREHHLAKYQWRPGQSGNPAGRKKGSRNQLATDFVADLHKDWQEHGFTALAAAREQKPADYLKVIASVLPRDIKVSLEDLSNGELSTRIDQLSQALGLKLTPTIDVTPERSTNEPGTKPET